MLRVTLEMVPFGQEESKYTIGVVEIGNTGTGTSEFGNYVVAHDGEVVGKIRRYPREQGAWKLVNRCLRFVA